MSLVSIREISDDFYRWNRELGHTVQSIFENKIDNIAIIQFFDPRLVTLAHQRKCPDNITKNFL